MWLLDLNPRTHRAHRYWHLLASAFHVVISFVTSGDDDVVMTARRAAGVLLLVMLFGCTPEMSRLSAPFPQAVSFTASAEDVVTIRTAAFPEGPVKQWDRGGVGAEEIFALLPTTLPAQLPQPPDCEMGNVTTLILTDGRQVGYGPCDRPASIDAVRCLAFGLPQGC